MTLYNVHLYREMRLHFPGVEANTPEEAARIAADKYDVTRNSWASYDWTQPVTVADAHQPAALTLQCQVVGQRAPRPGPDRPIDRVSLLSDRATRPAPPDLGAP